MAFTSSEIAGGVTGSLPNAKPAIDRIGTEDFQRVKLTDGTEGSTAAIGVDGNPLKVRPRRRGTADYDSGNAAVPSSATELTATLTYIERIVVTSLVDVQRWITVTNSAGTATVLSQYPIAPRQTVVIDMGGAELVGVKWTAEAAAALRGQVYGTQ